MTRNLKRLFAAVLLGVALTFGAATSGQLAHSPTVMQVADPGGGSTGAGGG